jgi:hypothetical protein
MSANRKRERPAVTPPNRRHLDDLLDRALADSFPASTRSLSTSIHLETGKRAKSAENDLQNGPETASGASLFSCARFGPDGSRKTAGNPAIEQHANSKAGCRF